MSFVAAGASGAGLGLLQYFAQKSEGDKQRNVQAALERYSPWTGQHGHPVANPNPVADVMQGAVAGLGQAQNLQSAAAGQQLQQGQLALMKAMTAHYQPGGQAQQSAPSMAPPMGPSQAGSGNASMTEMDPSTGAAKGPPRVIPAGGMAAPNGPQWNPWYQDPTSGYSPVVT